MLVVKIVLVICYDVFGEDLSFVMGVENRVKLEVRLRILEDRGIRKISGIGKVLVKIEKYEYKSEVKIYDFFGDFIFLICFKKCKIEQVDKEDEIIEKKVKKVKIKVKVEEEEEEKVVEEEEIFVKKKKKRGKKKYIKEELFFEEELCISIVIVSLEKKKKKKKKRENED